MVGNERSEKEMTRRKEAFISVLLAQPTIAAAAKTANVPETTARRWLREPDFVRAYRDARRQSACGGGDLGSCRAGGGADGSRGACGAAGGDAQRASREQTEGDTSAIKRTPFAHRWQHLAVACDMRILRSMM